MYTNAMDGLPKKPHKPRYQRKPGSKKIILVEKHIKKILPHIPVEFCALIEATIFTVPFFLSRCSSLKEAGQCLCNLASTNHFMNNLINDRTKTLECIKQLSQQFGDANIDVARKLCTKEANNRFALQKAFFQVRSRSFNRVENDINKLRGMGLELDFTYSKGRPTLLLNALSSSKRKWPHPYEYERDAIALWIIENGGGIDAITGSRQQWRESHVSLPIKQNASTLVLRFFHKDLIPVILQHQAFRVNYQDNNNDTPLHCCFYGLISHNTGSNVCDRHCTVDGERFPFVYETVRNLLEKGANPTVRNKQDKTPLNLAKQFGYQPLIELLENAVADFEFNRVVDETDI